MFDILSGLKKKYTKKEEKLFEFFKSSFLFKNLTNKELLHVIKHLHLREFKEGEIVFFRKDPALAVYMIKEGEVELDCDFDEKTEQLALCKKGDVFGFGAFSMRMPRLYNAKVVSHTAEIYLWPTVNIRDVFHSHPEVQMKIHMELVRFYEVYLQELFETYRRNYGFFQLSDLYDEVYENE